MNLLIIHKLAVGRIVTVGFGTEGVPGECEIHDATQANPDCFGTGRAVALAAEVAAERADDRRVPLILAAGKSVDRDTAGGTDTLPRVAPVLEPVWLCHKRSSMVCPHLRKMSC